MGLKKTNNKKHVGTIAFILYNLHYKQSKMNMLLVFQRLIHLKISFVDTTPEVALKIEGQAYDWIRCKFRAQ